MKTKNVLAAMMCSVCLISLLSGCLKDKESYTSVNVSCPAVVGYQVFSDGKASKYLGAFSYGAVIPANISVLDEYNSGDCATVQFTLDTRDQVTGADYWIGSDVRLERVEQTAVAYSKQPEDTTGCSFPITSVSLHEYYTNAFNYDGKFFVYITNKVAKTQKVEYSLQCDWLRTDENGARVMYLKGNVIGVDGAKETTESVYAFDLNEMFDNPSVWQEYTDEATGNKYRTLKVVLKYFTKTSEDELLYGYVNNSSSFTVYLYKGY
ncbi:MAG: hypothetical protein LBS54_05200 [Dysgonamonadaceae bacterium]|nr:hypothetical protein [Dysgonamonadaceae bacterium]